MAIIQESRNILQPDGTVFRVERITDIATGTIALKFRPLSDPQRLHFLTDPLTQSVQRRLNYGHHGRHRN